MEPARPRADQQALCGPRAGRLQGTRLHFGIWHIVPSFRDNPIVFFTACTFHRRKILASAKCEEILREIWQRSADHDGWWVGSYVLMPDHVHFFARPATNARPKAEWVRDVEER